MSLEERYPDLANFIGAWFPEADLDALSDEEVAVRFCQATSPENLASVLGQGRSLITRMDDFWQELGTEGNRHFASAHEAHRWLNEILEALERFQT